MEEVSLIRMVDFSCLYWGRLFMGPTNKDDRSSGPLYRLQGPWLGFAVFVCDHWRGS